MQLRGENTMQGWGRILAGTSQKPIPGKRDEMNAGKRKMTFLILAISFVFLIFPEKLFSLSCTESLKGLKGVEVLVEELKPELENYSLTMIQIQSDVESQLRMAGIEILRREENEKIQPLRMPYLYVRINSYKPAWRREVFIFNIEVALNQRVLLPEHSRYPEKPFYAPTWYTSSVGAVGAMNVMDIRDMVKDLADQFVRAYQKANPK
jgi:hypothetical protein